ncbi:MAG: serine hydrolase [Gemmatimonadetes bacterium]|nr:serine hydrolase [Gemmatimonadota bacterium]
MTARAASAGRERTVRRTASHRPAPAVAAAAIAALALAAACAAPDRPVPPSLARGIDAVFADLDRPGSPGASVAVIRDGELIHSRGYGEAQVEHGVPVTPRTIFHVASVSKEFTAMAVTLLAADGALSLDDPVQQHLDFVPDFEHPVTVRQMIHHTSGIRDQWQLLAMSGWRLDDVITTEQIRALMARQQELNFVPGSEYLYSNMGYTLLAQTVEAVSGMSFAEFTTARIFRPLGMDRTHFHDDHEHLVPGRAYSYRPAAAPNPDAEEPEGAGATDDPPRYDKSVLSYANAGATSLFTTAEDLARWLDNFRHETLGGPDVMETMKTRGILNGGDTIPYAHGLSVGEYRGLRTIGHGGADAGFRTQVNWFPAANTGVVVLTNVANGNPAGRARAVADVVLAGSFPEEEGDEDDAPAAAPETAPPETPGPVAPAEYAGTYYSPELDALHHVEASEDGLVARHIRHGAIVLDPRGADEFATGQWFFREVRFVRDGAGTVTEMRVGGGRVRNLRFVRLTTPLPG